METLSLRVLRAPEGSALAGTLHEIPLPSVILGRSPACDIAFPERTVSSRHVRLDLGPPPRIEVLTRSSGTFLNREPLQEGQIVPIRPGDRLQLGGVLMAIELCVTQSMRQPMVSGRLHPPEAPPLRIRFDLGAVMSEWRGWDLGLTGDAARFLGALAKNAGQSVSYADLRDADVKTKQLAPLATRVRRAFVLGVEGGHIDRDLLLQRLGAAGEALPADKLMLRLLDNRTDYGYRLRLLPQDVLIES